MSRIAAIIIVTLLQACAGLHQVSGDVPPERQAARAYAEGRLSDAEDLYLQLTRHDPESAESWFRLGNIYAESGRLVAAERAYRQALRQEDDPRVLHNLGLVQIRLGMQALEQARRQLPANTAAQKATRDYLETLLRLLP